MKYINEIVLSNNNPIILFEALRNDLLEKGKVRFRDIRLKSGDLNFTCPYHKKGNEAKPSAHMLLQPKGEFEVGFIKCFSCGKSTNLYEMISEILFNKYDDGELGRNYVNNLFRINSNERRFNFNLKSNNNFNKIKNTDINEILSRNNKDIYNYSISEEELDKYRFIHPYMYERGLTDEIINKFDIGYDSSYKNHNKEYECITFPVKDRFGRVITIMRRAIFTKRFFIEKNIKKPIYAFDKVYKSNNKLVFLTESIFNCLTLWVWGFEAVALIGLGTKEQFELLNNSFKHKTIVICMDGDKAGRDAAKNIRNKLKINNYIIDMYDNEDINSISKEDFMKLYKYYLEDGYGGNFK